MCLFLSAHIGAALFGFHTAKFLLSPLGFRCSPEPRSRWAVWIVSHLWATDPPPSPAPCVVLNYSWIPFNNKGTPFFPSLPPRKKKKIINECSWSLPTCSTHFERSHSSCSVNRAYIFFFSLSLSFNFIALCFGRFVFMCRLRLLWVELSLGHNFVSISVRHAFLCPFFFLFLSLGHGICPQATEGLDL